MPLSPPQQQVAAQIYQIATKAGLPANRARELVAASYAESSLDPRATNKSSGAAGLFQLLSQGYRDRAQSLGGLYDPVANTRAILPNYQSFWQQNPNAPPGAGGASVEASGMGSDFYSKPLSLIGNLGGGSPSLPPPSRPGPGGGAAPPPNAPAALAPVFPAAHQGLALALLKASQSGDYQPFFRTLQQSRTQQAPVAQPRSMVPTQPQPAAPSAPPTAGPQPAVQVDHNQPVAPLAAHVIGLAKQYLGTPYKWGGTTPKGFDCSGFVQWLYAKQGISMPRTTYEQVKVGKPVTQAALQPGDTVFFSKNGDVHHEGLYIGNGQFIHAPHTGDVIKISSLSDPYYSSQFAGGRRVAPQ